MPGGAAHSGRVLYFIPNKDCCGSKAVPWHDLLMTSLQVSFSRWNENTHALLAAGRAPSDGLPESWQQTAFFIGVVSGACFFLAALLKYPKKEALQGGAVFGGMAFLLAGLLLFGLGLFRFFLGLFIKSIDEVLNDEVILGVVFLAEIILSVYWARRFVREQRVWEGERAGFPICYCTEVGEVMNASEEFDSYRCPLCGIQKAANLAGPQPQEDANAGNSIEPSTR